MTGMQATFRKKDGQTIWVCPVCLHRETVWEESQLSHQVGGLQCLQIQVTSLQEYVEHIINKIGGL